MLSLVTLLCFLCGVLAVIGAARLVHREPPPSTGDALEGELVPSAAERWEQTARQAGLNWNRHTYITFVLIAVGVGILLHLAEQSLPAITVVAVGLVGPFWYVRHLQRRRKATFLQQLPPALFLAASVMRAGGTLLQAVDAIASEMPSPIGPEFRRIAQRMRLQVPAYEAMADVHARLAVPEFAAVIMAARITVEVGGNLAHIFDQIARSLMDSQNARRAVQAFTTEGRMSANLIAGLPFFVLAILHWLSPEYLTPFFTSFTGNIFLTVCLSTVTLGWMIIRRMVNIHTF